MDLMFVIKFELYYRLPTRIFFSGKFIASDLMFKGQGDHGYEHEKISPMNN